jgi:hypothetical protein
MKRPTAKLIGAAMAATALLTAGALCFTSLACAPKPDQSAFADLGKAPEPRECVVQLRCAKIPWVCAVHCWFAEYAPADGTWHRWEVWQNAGAGANDVGHVRKDLMNAGSGVGDGPSWVLAQWRGPDAQRLRQALESPGQYPYPQEYKYWPGPNSNTYAAWILKTAKVAYDLPSGALGKDYP